MAAPSFIHLHTHSAYSLAEGAIPVKDLVKLCVKHSMPALAVTDTNNLFGAMEFATEALKNGVQPIIGAQVQAGEEGHRLVLLVQNETGYRNLCKLLSDAYMQGGEEVRAVISLENLKAQGEGLICLTGGPGGALNHYGLHNQPDKMEEILAALKIAFPERLYIELQRHKIPGEARVEEMLIGLAYAHDIPLVATNDCYFAARKSYEAHDALLCIAEGRYITEEDRRKVTPEHYFKSVGEMRELFADIPEAIANTVVIARRCSFLLTPISPILPAYETAAGRTEFEELQAQAQAGLEWRLKNFVGDGDPQPYRERLEYELNVIRDMGYPGYFLIVSDFIRWAKDQNIPVGPGRGSGAGSVAAWALRITDLDPLKLGLLFERFLNPERVSMPDFDIDFCQERRDEVIRYVQGKYGRARVAQIITFGKLQARAVVRDVGRVLQLPYGQVDRIAKLIPNNPANPLTLQEAMDQDPELRAERDRDDAQKKLIDIALQLEGLYRHASTHAAGVVIGDRPLHELIPLYRDPRSDMPVTGFNMKYVEEAGLVKFDFLGLKTMTVIQKAVDMVNQSRRCHPERSEGSRDPSVASLSQDDLIDLLKIPLDDPKTYELMASGATVGVFQLESAGMRDTLRKVKPNRFEDIIALVSLYRPGPMDNIPKYGAVKDGREAPDYLHPKLKPTLEETYGILIYQEQVMQAAQVLAGYTLGGADLLRRAMGKKIQSEMDAQREMFVQGAAVHNQVPEAQASMIFDQIAKFAGYGFNKSHAAAYALIAYWTAWLKANHPLEFMAASMTMDLGNTDKLAVFKQDLDRMGVDLRPPDINKSDSVFTVEGNAVRYALGALKGVGEHAMAMIVRERGENGPYKSLEDFAQRLEYKHMNKRQFEQLAAAGGFDSLNPHRAQMGASAEIVLRHAQSLAEERASGQVSLFGGDTGPGLGLPALPEIPPWPALEQLAHEFSAVGFYLSAHPLDSRGRQFENLGIVPCSRVESDMQNRAAGRYQLAGVLLKKQEKVSQKGNKYAFLQLSDPSGVFEVTLFSDLLHAVREILIPGEPLLLTVEAEQREDQIRMTAQKIERLEDALDHKIREIEIDMGESANIPRLREFLGREEGGRSRILLHVALEGGRTATLELPGRWSLSAQTRDLLRTEPGIREVREA
ncbi:MAG: DNA polymerase III subunit alpha [Alphaproteobacteria bacterium]|nr:DNA polymerase III subunit alpha [Alphaproteobacteria bacterium]